MSISDRLHRLPPAREDAAVAAILGLPFAAYLVILNLVTRPTPIQWERADPILHLLPKQVTLWSVPALAVVVALVGWRLTRPSARALRSGLIHAAIGVAAAFAVAGTLRLTHGPVLPGFVPPEESAGPGFLLSMTAGFAEEVLFRFLMVPLLFFGLARDELKARAGVPVWAAAAIAVVASGLGFAVLHDLGPGAFRWDFFVTRFVFPGCVMSIAWFLFRPSFIVSAHAAAHLAIPALFVIP